MSIVRKVVLVAVIAALAVVPLRAFGVVGGGAPSALSVSASLAGCGVAGSGIVCTIDVSFGGVEGADYYTATLTGADGSVQDLGTVGSGEGGGSASVTVPYVGAGTYSVTVSAWGEPEDDDEGGEPELLDREDADSGKDDGKAEGEKDDAGEVSAEPAPAEDPAHSGADPAEVGTEPAPGEPAAQSSEPATQTLPECQPEPEPAEPTSEEGGAGAAEAAAANPPPAPAIECTEPSSDANGPCCPPGA